jgi:cytochrome oxidase Cu insertion factor (SCO1/SenC/PrrC family)
MSDNEDARVDFQMNQIFQLDDMERKRLLVSYLKRFQALGDKLSTLDAIKAEFIAKSLENMPEERGVYASLIKTFADSKSSVAIKAVQKLEARNNGRIRFLSLPGQQMELHGKTSDGKEWDIKELRGKVVVLYFCYEGAGLQAWVREAFDAYQGKLVVVGLNLDSTKKSLENSMKQAKNPWVTLTSIGRTDGPVKLFNDLAVDLGGSMPVMLIDKDGVVVSNGLSTGETRQQLEKLLGLANGAK